MRTEWSEAKGSVIGTDTNESSSRFWTASTEPISSELTATFEAG